MRKPLKPCTYSGCTELLRAGSLCPKHREPKKRTPEYNDKRWFYYSKAYRLKHPFCADPFGRHRGVLRGTQCVGHIVAHKGDEHLMWDPANHVPLCNSCNAYQCAKLEGGFGNKAAPRPHAERERSLPSHSDGSIYDKNIYRVPASESSDD